MSEGVYSRVATAIQESFFYLAQNALRTPVTGKVNGDFTKRLSKDGVGNQSTANVTITEIDAVNNPGEYGLAITAAAFVAVAGTYILRVTDTVNTQFGWEWTFRVTADGTASATIGPAIFTPVALNGRVVDGAVAPILGATIVIRRADNSLYATYTTDASGLWTAINFPATNAVYTIYAIRSGYQQASGTITVAAGIATGPGADLTMAAATAASGFQASDYWAYIKRMARNQSGTTATSEIQQAGTEALERLATCHEWPWYRRYGELALNAAYSTGTVICTNASSVVTLTGGTWPAWVTSGSKFSIAGQVIEVSSRTSNSQIVLVLAWNEVTTAASSYIVFLDRIALPDDLYKFGKILPGQRWGYGALPIGNDRLDDFQNSMQYGQKFADFYAIQGQYIYLSSYPTVDTQVRYSYYKRPATLVSGTDIVDWDPAHIRILRRAADCEVALRFGGYVGGTYEQAVARFKEALTDAIPNDRTESSEAAVLGTAFDSTAAIWKRRG